MHTIFSYLLVALYDPACLTEFDAPSGLCKVAQTQGSSHSQGSYPAGETVL